MLQMTNAKRDHARIGGKGLTCLRENPRKSQENTV